MSKKKNRKNKQKSYSNKYSPLGVLDYVIYIVVFLIFFIIVFSPLFVINRAQKTIAFNDSDVIAADTNNASLIFSFPFIFSFLLIIIVPLIAVLGKQCPIIGNLKKYKENNCFKNEFIPEITRFIIDIKSLFNSKKRVIICCSLLLLFLCLTPLSLFTRTTLSEDFSVEKYNIVNQKTKVYTTDDFDSLTIDVYSRSGKGDTTYGFAIEIGMENGDSIYINNYEFKNVEEKIDFALDNMLEIKNMFSPESVTIKDYHKLNRVIKELDLTEKQIDKLNELFSTP